MAKVEKVFLEIQDNIIIGVHSDSVDASNLPSGHTIQLENIENPDSILGLNTSYISLPVADRPKLNEVPSINLKRAELKKIVLELNLAIKLGEDTTDLDANFTTLKSEYDNLKSE